MLPQINNKSFLDCVEADFKVLLHNPDYRENQFIDYKVDFAFLKIAKNEEKREEKISAKICEFRNDICAFANSEGGYIIYGISDNQGAAADLIGVEIEDPDKYELFLRNKLTPILPKVPPIQFRFVKLSNGRYLVIMYIGHDYYAPNIHIEDQKNYRIYKRDGNQKTIVGYTELKNMFIQSRVLEDEIQGFRKKRIEYFENQGNQALIRFMLFHIIPESFLNDRKPLFLIEQQQHRSFGSVFSGARIDTFSLPCVDGLRYENITGDEKAILYNNGIAELLLPLDIYVLPQQDGELWFYADEIWEYVESVLQGYQSIMPDFFGNQRCFGCISIIGCKDAGTEHNGHGRQVTKIDRDEIIIPPISLGQHRIILVRRLRSQIFRQIGQKPQGILCVLPRIFGQYDGIICKQDACRELCGVALEDLEDEEAFNQSLKRLHLEYLLSIGIRRSEIAKELINEITNHQDN